MARTQFGSTSWSGVVSPYDEETQVASRMGRRGWRTLIATVLASSLAAAAGATAPGPADWPTYGHDLHRTFSASTTLDQTTVHTLAPAWFFPTGDAVTANPIEVGGTIYVGSWDGNFYAIEAVSGQLRWSFAVDADQQKISPQPGNRQPSDVTSDGGIITSAAYFLPGVGSRPDLVIFGAGYRLYAVVANDDASGHRAGTLYWKHLYSGRPELPPDPANDGTRIFSSPAVGHQRQYSQRRLRQRVGLTHHHRAHGPGDRRRL